MLLKKFVLGDKFIVIEGIFSMDGDSVFIYDLVVIVKVYDVWFMFDDVYGMGVLGEWGLGIVEVVGFI